MAMIPKTNPPRVLDALKMKVGVRVPGGSGAGYRILTGASVLDLPSGTRAVSQIPTFDGTATIAAAKSNENISFSLGVWNPLLPVHQDLARADANRLTVAGRMDIYAEKVIEYGKFAVGGLTTKAAAGIGVAKLPDPATPERIAKGNLLTGATPAALTALKDEFFRTDLLIVGDIIQIAAASPTTRATRAAASYIINYIEEDEETGDIGDVFVTKMDGSVIENDETDIAADIIAAWEAGWRQPFSGKINELRSHAADASGSPQLSSSVSFTPQGKLPKEQPLYVELSESDWLGTAI